MEVIPEALQKIARLTGRRKLIFRLAPGSCDAQLSNDVLKGSYWPSKSTDFEILSPLQKIRGVAKKDTATILIFWARHE